MSDLKSSLEALRLDQRDATPRRRPWIPLIALLTLLIVGFWGWRASAGLRALEVETARATVRQTATVGEGQPVLTASGYLVARREAIVSAKIQGRLSELRVEEGTRVRAGDVIARLESADFVASLQRARAQITQVEAQLTRADAAIQRAEANLAEARRQYTLSQKLLDGGVVSTDNRDAAESRVRIAEAELSQARADRGQIAAQRVSSTADVAFAQAQLDNTVIRAPFAGTVVRKMAEIGESVAPIPPGVNISTASGAIVALADLATLEMEADVAEANVAQLVAEQPAEVTVEAFPDKRFRAVLRQVIPTADRTKATVQVKVTVVDKDETLKPEMSAKVTFLTPAAKQAAAGSSAGSASGATSGSTAGVAAGANGAGAAPPSAPLSAPAQVLAPQTAVATRNGASVVFEIQQDVVKARPVTTGQARQGDIVITTGLNGGELLVNRPPDALKDGDRVKAKS